MMDVPAVLAFGRGKGTERAKYYLNGKKRPQLQWSRVAALPVKSASQIRPLQVWRYLRQFPSPCSPN